MKELHILSLGAGVQSTTVYLLAMEGALDLDAAIFADTQDEPQAVYRHLEWLKSLNGPEIYVRTRGRLSADLMRGENSTHQRFSPVPFYTRHADGEIGRTKRQCSKEYKVEVIERSIRRDILGLKPRQRIPKGVEVHQYFGISLDEARRTVAIRERLEHHAHFPLIDRAWTRNDCLRYLETRVPHPVPKSACVYCPFHSDAEWLNVKAVPEDWALAVRVDEALRQEGVIVNRTMDSPMFAHRSGTPLATVELRHERQFNLFNLECEGMCGV